MYGAAAVAAYPAHVTWWLGPTGNPWTWGEFRKREVVLSPMIVGTVMLARLTRLGLIPGRLLELGSMADHIELLGGGPSAR